MQHDSVKLPPGTKASRFRFKDESRKRSRPQGKSEPGDVGKVGVKFGLSSKDSSHPRKRHHSHHHRTSHTTSDRGGPGSHTPRPAYTRGTDLAPENAFAESLYDAMADEEGAAYWQGVYGQPIHIYSRFRSGHGNLGASPDRDRDRDGNEKKPIQMTDKEFVSLVRRKMWEKSYGYVKEERRRRERETARRSKERRQNREMHDEQQACGEDSSNGSKYSKQEDQGQRRHPSAHIIEIDIDALRDGKAAHESQRSWSRYSHFWSDPSIALNDESQDLQWPVDSGRLCDVVEDRVCAFFKNAAKLSGQSSSKSSKSSREKDGLREREDKGRSRDGTPAHTAAALESLLKRERIRWHPDKMQQRATPRRLEDDELKAIVLVFQTIDRMWTAMKKDSMST